MFRKLLLGIVLAIVTIPAAWGGGFEFDVSPTTAAVDPGTLAPFLWVSPVMVEDAPAISLSWNAPAPDKRETRIELEVAPFASIEVNGHTRAIIVDLKGTISVVGEGEWEIEQCNFWNTFAYSIYIEKTNRLTFSLPVKLKPQGENTKDSFRTQLLVPCIVNEDSTALSCAPPLIEFLEPLKYYFPDTPSADSLFEEKTVPLRRRMPAGTDLVSKVNPRLPPGSQACCYNSSHTHCKCLSICPIGYCDQNCVFCSAESCLLVCDLYYGCIDGCA